MYRRENCGWIIDTSIRVCTCLESLVICYGKLNGWRSQTSMLDNVDDISKLKSWVICNDEHAVFNIRIKGIQCSCIGFVHNTVLVGTTGMFTTQCYHKRKGFIYLFILSCWQICSDIFRLALSLTQAFWLDMFHIQGQILCR